MRKLVWILLITVGVTVMMAINTAAYIDPSAVSTLIQVVAMSVIAVGATVTIFWKKLRLFFKKTFKKNTPPAPKSIDRD